MQRRISNYYKIIIKPGKYCPR